MTASTSAIYAWAESLRQRMLQEFQVLLEAEYHAAFEETEGVMVCKDSREAGWTSWSVFKGNPQVLQKHASEELWAYLQAHPRTTRTEFEKDWLDRFLGSDEP